MSHLDVHRLAFAQGLREGAHLKSDVLVNAFATVPRELYLGPGPWNVLITGDDGQSAYRLTENANPEQTYRNVVIAIDPARGLHNGEPEALAMWMNRLELKAGDSVVQIGAGTGYYTAIFAEVVGPTGRVLAFEIDVSLAARAKANLDQFAQVQVVPVAATKLPPDSADAVFVNCGVTVPPVSWLSCLRKGGRLVLPITASPDNTGVGTGAKFLFTREANDISIQYISPAGFFSLRWSTR
jgi:protein-L-isoaspartate(D-aspartate) O-methyltransferase